VRNGGSIDGPVRTPLYYSAEMLGWFQGPPPIFLEMPVSWYPVCVIVIYVPVCGPIVWF